MADEQIWHHLFDVIKRGWFCRAWIVQEVAVSNQAIPLCGHAEFDWDSFSRAILYTIEARGFGTTLGSNAFQQLNSLGDQF